MLNTKSLAAIACLLAACNDGGKSAEPALYTPLGAFDVESAEMRDRISYLDVTGQPRGVNIKVYRPTTAGLYPLVVLSHGGADGITNATNAMDKWSAEIAKAGYVAVALAHRGRDVASYDALCEHLDVPSSLEIPDYRCGVKINFDRPNDVDAVLDYIEANQSDPRWSMVDLEHVAHVGHSAGAGAAMMLAGTGRNFVCAQPYGVMQGVAVACDPADLALTTEPRIDAVLALSPQGPGTDGFMTESFGTVQAPVMMVSGANDGDPGEPATRLLGFNHLPDANPHWKLYVDDPAAIHVLFEGEVDRCAELATDDRCTEMKRWIFSTGLAFLDAQLKDRPEAHAWLASEDIEAVSANDATLEAGP